MNQKLEELLRLALQTPEEQRAKTEELNVGFDSASRTWELIVKYHGSLEGLETLGITVEPLIAGYAILTVPELFVEALAELEPIEYVEKPKRYFYGQVDLGQMVQGVADGVSGPGGVTNPTQGSCIEAVTLREPFLTGTGVLVAVLDSGIDYKRPEFRGEDGSTRILYLWDQTLQGEGDSVENGGNAALETDSAGRDGEAEIRRPPTGFALGVEFTAEQINSALAAGTPQEQFMLLPSVDTSGHGTAVAGIAAGNSGNYRGVAPQADLLIVKLGLPDASSFPRTTEIMRAVTYAVNKAVALGSPLVINLSFGNTYGAHDGSSLLERFLDNAAEIGRTVICVGSGNEGNNGGHLAGSLLNGAEIGGRGRSARSDSIAPGRPGTMARTATVELAVAEYERSLSIQLWKNYSDRYRVILRSPGGREEPLPETVNGGKYTLRLEQTEILVYMGEPTPYSVSQEIYLELLPVGQNYINSGVWSIRLEVTDPEDIVTGNYYFYLPGGTVRNSGTGFYRPTPDVTLTIPSTASKVITVGAYDSTYDAYADFSGRGYSDEERTIGVVTAGLAKPDLVAPGVNVKAPDIYGGFIPVTGTSFATPIVAGSAALLMEWGIVRGNDAFLYGEKVKAYLRKGARQLRGEAVYPNARVGWGALCVGESVPKQ